jgi:hypothetical protein
MGNKYGVIYNRSKEDIFFLTHKQGDNKYLEISNRIQKEKLQQN